ncbi:hypothetical protein [Tardiphaga sp.]|jgi:hypothetical protein|uniref:hypothetical protein n=1 Tax=Tardiphaga sp. TaxID=1926292 RepID=UPI00263384BA|nr:hypothetical protein [Tardiphaga sp.]
MNKPNAVSQAMITRAMKAALKAGLIVTGVKPDGTVLTAMPGSVRAAPGDYDDIADHL